VGANLDWALSLRRCSAELRNADGATPVVTPLLPRACGNLTTCPSKKASTRTPDGTATRWSSGHKMASLSAAAAGATANAATGPLP